MSSKHPPLSRDSFNFLVEVKQTERHWHIPLLASLCAGIPLSIGLYLDRPDYGLLASTAGLVILYLPPTSLQHRTITMLSCSLGLMLSYTIGICFSFNPFVSSIVLGLTSFCVQWLSNFFRMKPPGAFFFIMIASIASAAPFNISSIPSRVGIVGMGTMLACILAFIYSYFHLRKHPSLPISRPAKKSVDQNRIESGLVGGFMAGSLLIAHLLELHNPYWVPISCLAVMQGVSREHIWQRSVQRILGTMIGLGLAWLLLSFQLNSIIICASVFILQFIIEMLVVRNYGLAVIFITPLTLFLAEAASALTADPNQLIPARMLDIAIGSVIGAIAGWFVHNEQLEKRVASISN